MGLGTGTKEEALSLPYITEKNSQEISLTWQNRRLALVLKISDFFFFLPETNRMASHENTVKKIFLACRAASLEKTKTKYFSTVQAYSLSIVPGKIHHCVVAKERGLYSLIYELITFGKA